jgi:hypothetical protein
MLSERPLIDNPEPVVSTRAGGGGVDIPWVVHGLTGEFELPRPDCVAPEIVLEIVSLVSVLGRATMSDSLPTDKLGVPPGSFACG